MERMYRSVLRIFMKIWEFHRDGIFPTSSSPFKKMYQLSNTPSVTSHILLVFGAVCWFESGVCSSHRMERMEFFSCNKATVSWMEFSKNSMPKIFAKIKLCQPRLAQLTTHPISHASSPLSHGATECPPQPFQSGRGSNKERRWCHFFILILFLFNKSNIQVKGVMQIGDGKQWEGGDG